MEFRNLSIRSIIRLVRLQGFCSWCIACCVLQTQFLVIWVIGAFEKLATVDQSDKITTKLDPMPLARICVEMDVSSKFP